jgi:hypothetical protein
MHLQLMDIKASEGCILVSTAIEIYKPMCYSGVVTKCDEVVSTPASYSTRLVFKY